MRVIIYELGFEHNKFQVNIRLGDLNGVIYATDFEDSIYSKTVYRSEEEGNLRLDGGGKDVEQADVWETLKGDRGSVGKDSSYNEGDLGSIPGL